MESYLTAVGIGFLDLIIGRIRFAGTGYRPHGSIRILKTGIPDIIDPVYRDRSGNFGTVLQRSGHRESTAVFRIDSSDILSVPDNGNLFLGMIVIDDTYGLRKFRLRTDIAGYRYPGNGIHG